MTKENHNCDNINCNHNDTKGLCCLFNPENCKYRQLQKENEVLKGRIEGFEKQILGLLYKYESVYKRFPDLKDAMNKAESILKENAELKEKLGIYQKGMFDEIEKRDINLTKAKEILKSLYFIIESRIDYKNNIEIADEMWRAEQFLNSEVEK